jgi:multisubunit Na+/H+ antiporter MnhE subunit
MTRNTLLFVSAFAAIIVGLLVSYFPPTQNAVAIWSLVAVFFGYAIKDLFEAKAADPAASAPSAPVETIPATPTI